MKKNSKHDYDLLLIIGLALFLIGLITNLFFNIETSVEDNPILGMIRDMNGWIVLVAVVIIAPILEEISFRSWTIKKNWTKYLTLVLASVFIAISLNIYAGLIFTLAFLAIMFLLKEKPISQTYSFVALTSLGFALCHYGNLDLENFLAAFPLYFGLALVLSFIAIRAKLRYAIFAHSIYNFLLLLLSGFIISFGGTTPIEDSNYKGTLTGVSGFYSTDTPDIIGDKTIEIHKKSLAQIASYLIENKLDYQFKTYPKNNSFSNLNIVSKDSNDIDLSDLLKKMTKDFNLRIDTISEIKTVYFLEVKDIEKIKCNKIVKTNNHNIYPNELQYIVSSFAESQNVIIRVPEELKKVMIKDDIAFFRKNMQPLVKLPEALKNVEKKYGFVLTPKQAEVKTIRIFELD
ncbi:MAG: CPBP family intramembrane glutamic endopeptidase [Bacteroidales bacterium]